MLHQDGTQVDHLFRFGPFSLSVKERLLLENGQPVQVGSRGLEMLIMLLERHGEVIGKPELMARVWPTTVVVESNLAAQMTALRRVLRDGRDGRRFIISEPGRGYRFVAPVSEGEAVEPMAPSLGTVPLREAPSFTRMMELCSGFIQPLENELPTPEGKGATVDAVLQRGIQALEFARALVSSGDFGGDTRPYGSWAEMGAHKAHPLSAPL